MEEYIKDDVGVLSTTFVNVGEKQVPIDTCYNKKDFPDIRISEEDVKNPKLKVGVGLLHYNNTAYPFTVYNVDYVKRVCKLVAMGNNYVETVNSNLMEVSFDIINKEFETFTIPIEHEL